MGDSNKTEVYTSGIWGEFTLSYQKIKGSVHFALLEYKNVLCWTVATGYLLERESIIIHLTINWTQKQSEFIKEITEFLEDQTGYMNELFSG